MSFENRIRRVLFRARVRRWLGLSTPVEKVPLLGFGKAAELQRIIATDLIEANNAIKSGSYDPMTIEGLPGPKIKLTKQQWLDALEPSLSLSRSVVRVGSQRSS